MAGFGRFSGDLAPHAASGVVSGRAELADAVAALVLEVKPKPSGERR
jgi:hypothetical protein